MPPAGVTISTSADLKDIAGGLHDKNSRLGPRIFEKSQGILQRVSQLGGHWSAAGWL